MVTVAGNRKLFLALAAVALPVAIGGLVFLQQSRNVGFLDAKDDSTIYRQTMWRDGIRLWTESPRNFIFGVGMDSTQRYWREWGMFDGGRLPMGHFHSTPVQLLAERGLPALALWLGILCVYGWILWKGLKSSEFRVLGFGLKAPVATAPGTDTGPVAVASGTDSWVSRGILLGCLGGLVGFFTSGLVHYNLGDQEVAMMFFLLMGIGAKTAELTKTPADELMPAEMALDQRLAA
jgi:O-antigen ligase